MISVGLTGWGDHDSLYGSKTPAREKLKEYASYFPIVEVDTSFYAIQPIKNVERWVKDTPTSFKFIVKAYQGMTGHLRGENPFQDRNEMFEAFCDSLRPYREADKLAMVLFQFPPWFDCKRQNVDYIRWCRDKMGDIPSALEFRNRSWFMDELKNKTLQFMKQENWIHSICDEPQAGSGSVPIVLESTSKENVLVRFHGRNIAGWNRKTAGDHWREVRYLYKYNENELKEWASKLTKLNENTKNVYVLFNNNSGGDAADNALQMLDLLNIEYRDLNPRQLGLF